MKSYSKIAATAIAVSSLLLSSCGLTEGVQPKEVSKDDPRVGELNTRVTSYWRTLAEGDSKGAFEYLSARCKDMRVKASKEMLSSYEQRQINKMAYLRKSTDEIVNSMNYTIKSVNSGNKLATVSFDSSFNDIDMNNLRWERSDVDNVWYLDSCRPPFSSKQEDQSSFRLERERDSRAYEQGMIEDDGNYNDGKSVDSNVEGDGGSAGY